MAPWLIVALTVSVVYVLDRWEHRIVQSIFDWFPSILLAYVIPAMISMVLDVDYSSAMIHEYSKMYFIPLAVVAVMSSLSIAQLRLVGWKPIFLFFMGSMWIALFPGLLFLLFRQSAFVQDTLISDQLWMGIPPIVGSWIGGSTSQLVLKELVGCPDHIFLIILVIDNVLVNIWTIIMFQTIKRSDGLNQLLGINSSAPPSDIEKSQAKKISPWVCIAILLAVILLTNMLVHSFTAKIVLLSLIGLLLSNLIPTWDYQFSLRIGSILILVVMSVLGLKLQFDSFSISPVFIGFLLIWLIGHFGIMLLVARLLNIHSAWVPIASMANVGGIATAPAVTAAYERQWMPHAVILAILSMATGTFWGMATIYLLKLMV